MAKAELEVKPGDSRDLLNEIRNLIEEARRQTAAAVNVGLTALYWRIGNRILREVLGNERATYGEQIVATLSRQLVADFGRGFADKNLRRMMQFAEAFPDEEIVATLSRQLSWSHLKELLPLARPHQREFYAEMSRIEGWSVRTLRERIDSMLYERTALSKQPDELVKQELAVLRNRGNVTPAMLLKDPYILDFLGLADRYLERDLEDAILRELETFLLELGAGFSFVARQKRIQLDGEDFYIDLLFYNRKLKRLIVVDLSREASSLSTRVRWSFIFAGWRSTRQNSANRARWALFCAPGRTLSRSSCLNSGRRAFTSLNTSRFYLLPRFSGRSCTKLSKQLG